MTHAQSPRRYRPRPPAMYHDEQRDGDQFVTSTDLQREYGSTMAHVEVDHHVLIVIRQRRAAVAILPIAELERLRRIERRWEGALADGLHDLDV